MVMEVIHLSQKLQIVLMSADKAPVMDMTHSAFKTAAVFAMPEVKCGITKIPGVMKIITIMNVKILKE